MPASIFQSLPFKKVLITGATGYIGKSLLTKLLELKCDITCLNSSQPLEDDFKNFDVTHITYTGNIASIVPAFENGRFDYIFHLAGYQAKKLNAEELNTTLSSNIIFGSHLLEIARHYDAEHFIYAESFFQFDENGSYMPRNIYAASKQAFSDILLSYSLDGLKSTSLVMFDVYGPADSRDKLFNRLEKASKSSQELALTPGNQKHYAIYISDVVAAFCFAAEDQTTNSFNRYWVAGEGITLKQTIEQWCKIKQKALSIKWGGVDYFPNQVLQPFIGEKVPGWSAEVFLEEGLKKI